MAIEVGSTVTGRVTGITDFGAFVELNNGKTGLVHISEVADDYVKDINNYLEKNEEVKVKVISIDGEGKIGLSIKQLDDAENGAKKGNGRKRSRRGGQRRSSASFEKKLSNFMKNSDRRQKELRRNRDDRKGSRGR